MSGGIWKWAKRGAARLLTGVLSAALRVGALPAVAQTAPLGDSGESLRLMGDVLAVVNTNFSAKKQVSGNFYAQEELFAVEDVAFNRYVDEQSGQEMTVIEPDFEPLVLQGVRQVTTQNKSLRALNGYHAGDTRAIRDERGNEREVCCLYEGRYCTDWGSPEDA